MKVSERDDDLEEQVVIQALAGLRNSQERDPSAAHEGKKRFLEQAQAYQALVVRPRAVQHKRFSFWPALRASPNSILLALGFLLVVLAFGSAGAVYAAQESLPGQPLYVVKIESENLRLQMTVKPLSRLALILEYSDRRVDEMVMISQRGKPVPESVEQRWEQHIQSALQLTAGMDDIQRNLVMAEIQARMEQQMHRLTRINVKETGDAVLLRLQNQLRERIEQYQGLQPAPADSSQPDLPGEGKKPGTVGPELGKTPESGGDSEVAPDNKECKQAGGCPQPGAGTVTPVQGRSSTPVPEGGTSPQTGESGCPGCTQTQNSPSTGTGGSTTSTPNPEAGGGSGSPGSGSGGGKP